MSVTHCRVEKELTGSNDRGYVALAVATDKDTITREVETGLGGDREANMLAFAEGGLKLVRDVLKNDQRL